MPNVPNKPISWRVKDKMQSNSKLDRSKICGKMPTGLRYRIKYKSSQFIGKPWQLATPELPKFAGRIDRFK
jgi:hypothetical protein